MECIEIVTDFLDIRALLLRISLVSKEVRQGRLDALDLGRKDGLLADKGIIEKVRVRKQVRSDPELR